MSTGATVIQRDKTQVSVSCTGRVLTVQVCGLINEDLNFTKLLETMAGLVKTVDKICFDLSKVTRINSVGVREWLLFFERATHSIPSEILAVSEVMVEQAGIVPTLFGKKSVPVRTFEVPYFCEPCGQPAVATLRPEDVGGTGGNRKAPAGKCGKCGGPLEFDGIEEQYFRFLDYKS